MDKTKTLRWNLESAAQILWRTWGYQNGWSKASYQLTGISLFLAGFDEECQEDAVLLADIAMYHELNKRGLH